MSSSTLSTVPTTTTNVNVKVIVPITLVLLAVGASTTLVQCTSLDDLANGSSSDAGAGDGAGGDASEDQASSPIDASATDAVADIDAALGFCAKQQTNVDLCEDFDNGAFPPTGWTFKTANGGTLVRESGVAQSLPAALHATSTGAAGDDVAVLSRLLGTSAKRFVFAASIRGEKWSATERANLVSITIGSAGKRTYVVSLTQYPDSTKISEFAPADGAQPILYREINIPLPLPIGAWRRVVIELSIASEGAGTISASYDGTKVVDAVAVTPTLSGGFPQLAIGLPYVRAPQDGWDVRFDDVTFDVE